VSAVLNITYVLSVQQIALPWAVMPIFLGGVGMALIFPVLALAVLDMYPHQRGLASSMQMFIQLMINTVVAGVVSPMLSSSPVHLALGYMGFFALGGSFWYWERYCERRREVLTPIE
jgi:DHA1 family bicyclomycin/chloramphenicol resistance-like MFS transporter